MKSLLQRDLVEKSVVALVFLFPVTMPIISSAVSSIHFILFIIGAALLIKKKLPAPNSIEKKILVGFFIAFLLYFLGMFNSDALYQGFKKLGKFDKFLFAIPVFLVLIKYREAVHKASLWGLILTGPVLLGYLITTTEVRSLTGAYHSIMYGSFAMLVCGVTLFWALLGSTDRLKIILLSVSSLCALAASFGVGARGSWLALPILIVMMVWLFVNKKDLRAKLSMLFALIILVSGFVLLANPSATLSRVNSSVQSVSDFFEKEQTGEDLVETSSGSRLVMWKASIGMLKKNPMFGTGTGDFTLDWEKFVDENPRYKLSNDFTAAHSVFFEWLATLGLLGFAIAMWVIFLMPLWYFFKHAIINSSQQWVAVVGVWVVLSSMVFGLTESWIVRSAPNGVYVFFVLLAMALMHQKETCDS